MTPGCSACGYIVDFLRSCYSSSWRLFQGSDVETPGYYFFAPDGAKTYPGVHNLWSYNWTTDDFARHRPHLGEVPPASTWSRPWRNGSLPIAPPPSRMVGDAECIQYGERLPLPVIDRTLIAGIDSRCWPIPPQNADAGVRVGGSMTEPAGEDLVAGVRVGGSTSDQGEDVDAGVRVGGSPQDPVIPGNSCATAGVGTLGVLVSKTARPAGQDWYQFAYTSGAGLTIDVTVLDFGKESIIVYSGSCASLTTLAIISFAGSYVLPAVTAPDTISVEILITSLTGTDYDFRLF